VTKADGKSRATNVVRTTGDIHFDTPPGQRIGKFSIDYIVINEFEDKGIIKKVMNVQVGMDVVAGYSMVFKLKFAETGTN
jgi:hypothetical protein